MPPRHAIKDADWERIKDLLPGQPGQHGKVAKNNRLFIDGALGALGGLGVRPSSAAHNAVGLAGESPVVGIDCLPT